MAVKVVGHENLTSEGRAAALKWGRVFDARGLEGNKYIPPTATAPGFLIIGRGGITKVIPSGEPELPEEEPFISPSFEAVRVTHGIVSSYFLGPPGIVPEGEEPQTEPKPVKVRKSNSYDSKWREDETPQVSHPATSILEALPEYKPAIALSKHAAKWSHFVAIKASQYSGWARMVAQCGLGIGYGQYGQNETVFDDYLDLTYQFKDRRSDGVVFPIPKDVDNITPGFKPFTAANVRIDLIRGRLLAAPVPIWHKGAKGKAIFTEEISNTELWDRYVTLLASADEDTSREEDALPAIKEVLRKFGGIPLPHTMFSIPTNIPDKEGGLPKAVEQRIRAGAIAEKKITEPFPGVSICGDRGWAFDYVSPTASHVYFKYDSVKGIYKGVHYWWDIELEKQDGPESLISYPNLVAYLDYWVSQRGIDFIAASYIPNRFTHDKLIDFEYRALASSLDSKALLIDILKEEVEEDHAVYKITSEPRVLREGYFVNWKRGLKQIMDCEIKVPSYTLGGVVSIGAPSIPVIDVPPESRDIHDVSPLDIFFTKDGGVITSDMVSIPGGVAKTEVTGGHDGCQVSNYTTTSTTYLDNPIARFVRTNVYDPSDNTYATSSTVLENEVEPVYDYYSISDFLTDPGKGIIRKFKQFRSKTTTYTEGHVTGGTGVVFPMWEREAVFIAKGATGVSQKVKAITHNRPVVSYSQVALYERCFPGYWSRSPEYFSCQDENHQSCPSFPGQGFGEYPRTISFPTIGFSVNACTSLWGLEGEIFFKCDNADALYDATKDLDLTLPDNYTEVEPADKSAYVYAHCSTLGERVEKSKALEHQENPELSIYWFYPSPDPDTGDLAYFNAVSSCMGKPGFISYSSINDAQSYTVDIPEDSEYRPYVSPASSFIGSALGEKTDDED